MGKFVDKLAGALGFTTNEADDQPVDEYDEYDSYGSDDGYQEPQSAPVRNSRSSRRSSRYGASSRYEGASRFEDNRYDNGSSFQGSSYQSSSYQDNSYSSGMSSGMNSNMGASSFTGSSSFSSAPSFTGSASSYQDNTTPFPKSQSRPSFTASAYRTTSSVTRDGSKVLNLNASVQMEVVVASPETFEEARAIAQNIRESKPVIINLEFVEHSIAQRITDFLCGCCCAVEGNIQRIADRIFMIAPGNVDFAGDVDLRQSLASEGLTIPIR